MKKAFVFFAVFCCHTAVRSQSIISYGNNFLTKDEFLRAYNKNKPATADKQKAMRDYLDLYINFKLKVKAAEELRLDTVSQIKYDVQNFRDQIIENYLNDERGMRALTEEAVNRAAKELHVLYFSVPVAAGASPADTMKAFMAAKELYSTLQKRGADYAAAVSEVSAKIIPVKFIDLGFISAFAVRYESENIIYNTKPGNVSEPYRTEKGWNIFKVTEERPATGKWKVAQVLFSVPPDADNNTKLALKAKADSVYNLLQKGLAFSEATMLYSDDRYTSQVAGELPEFSAGKYTTVFEKNVFSLRNVNEITKPFETEYGYHIVKLLSHTPFPADKNDPALMAEIKQKTVQDSRINSEKEKFIKEITLKTGFKKIGSINDGELMSAADTLMKNPTLERTNALPVSKKTIYSFKNGIQVKGDEWLKFVRDYRSNPEQNQISSRELLKKFMAQAVINYYKKNLETFNTDFKYQMQEFTEGNMLFEIMERKVWSKAAADSSALINYYNSHKENYRWGTSAEVLIFNCADEKAVAGVRDSLAAGKTWTVIAEASNGKVQADSGRYELNQIPGSDNGTLPRAGSYSQVIKNADGSFVMVKYLKLYDANVQRTFAEARGLVINDYQNVLEKYWLDTLRKKYPVKINEVLFRQLVN